METKITTALSENTSIHLSLPKLYEQPLQSFLEGKGMKIYSSIYCEQKISSAIYVCQCFSTLPKYIVQDPNKFILFVGDIALFYKFIEVIHHSYVGFILYEDNFNVLIKGLTNLKDERDFISEKVSMFLLKETLKQQQELLDEDLQKALTGSEVDILYHLATGKMATEIAILRQCSESTVQAHIKNARQKLNLNYKSSTHHFVFSNKYALKTLSLLNPNLEKLNEIVGPATSPQ